MLLNYARKDGGEPLETKLASLELKVEGKSDDYLTISGYGSVFGNKDNGGDIVMPGAFKECIASGRRPKMLWNHDPSQPIGAWDEMSEDENGLLVKGRVSRRGKAGEIAELIEMGGIEGLSIGYRTQEYEMDMDEGSRKLTKLDLWETSVVTFPMNELAGIYAMKADEITQRDLERAFKNMGHSNRMAKAMAGGAWKARAEVLRDADTGVPEQVQRDVDELKALLTETLQTIGGR
ncbi:MAG: HK97 family phage prohead protease [Verrucomicrobiales bacterium]|nr:HK97 family phage prohead protease [Verrucomicrobiales bacterium]